MARQWTILNQIEVLRRAQDKRPSQKRRDQINDLIWKAQRSGKLGTLDIETMAGPEESES